MFETIVAFATPLLKSALGIIRLSGEDCFDIINKIFDKDLNKNQKNTINHGYIINNKETVDEVVLLSYISPNSFTGENSVEIISHGSPLIMRKILELCIKYGARQALAGEFTSRAFMNGKMNLLEAESINDLINSTTEESKKISMMALKGNTTSLILPIKKDFGDLLSNIEVNIDYPEYKDIEEVNLKKIEETAKKNIKYIKNLIKNGEKGQTIKDGVNIALVGKPNVGKSSLLNALLNEDKAIVSNEKGTTRDIVEGTINLNGIVVNFYDTAGIRESDSYVENIGISKTKNKIENANIVIGIFESTSFDEEDEEIYSLIKNKQNIIVVNKKDLNAEKSKKFKNAIYISALNKDIEPLKNEIYKKLGLEKENYDLPSIASSRALGILSSIEFDLEKILQEIQKKTPIDLLSSLIKEVYLKILSLLGEDNDFDVSKEIFSRFCVGK